MSSLVGPRIGNSAVLVLLSGAIGTAIAFILGSIAAVRRGGIFDEVSSVVALAITSLPEFVVAVGLIIVFAANFSHVLPAVSVIPPGVAAWREPSMLVLPVAALVIAIVPYIFRMTRASMIEALESDYVEMARLKGVPMWKIVLSHALPNAIPPTIQVIGLSFLYLAGGIVIVEDIFDYPGIGQGLVNAVQTGHPGDPAHRDLAGRLLCRRQHLVRHHRPRRHAPTQDPARRGCGALDVDAERSPAKAPARRAPAHRRREWLFVLTGAVKTRRGRVGLILTLLVVLVAVIGPKFAPYSPNVFVTSEFSTPSHQILLGGTPSAGTSVAGARGRMAAPRPGSPFDAPRARRGTIAGMAAAYRQGVSDGIIMRCVDVLLAFPQLIFALMLVSILGSKLWLLVIAVGLAHAPQVARVVRATTLGVSERDYVTRQILGIRPWQAMVKDIFPNLDDPLMVEAGIGSLTHLDPRRALVSRLRAPAAGAELGNDDQREPDRPDGESLGSGRFRRS